MWIDVTPGGEKESAGEAVRATAPKNRAKSDSAGRPVKCLNKRAIILTRSWISRVFPGPRTIGLFLPRVNSLPAHPGAVHVAPHHASGPTARSFQGPEDVVGSVHEKSAGHVFHLLFVFRPCSSLFLYRSVVDTNGVSVMSKDPA